MTTDNSEPGIVGPHCPSCQRPLRETLRVETVETVSDGLGGGSRVQVSFCGACGVTFSALPPPQPLGPEGVPEPDDPDSIEGRFQLRCRELIEEIQVVGFMPGGWIGLITHHGAVDAARELLSTGRILPVTRWLVDRGRAELTMEHEITRDQWAGIFDETERAEARRRLAQAADEP